VPLPDPDPAVAAAIGGKYAGKKTAPLAVTMRDRLGEWMTDELFAGAFGHTVLSEFRTRVAEHGLEEAALDALLAKLTADGLLKARGKQRTDSTHVIAAVRGLHTIELAGESVRAALEALAAACPDWLAARLRTASPH
jgi:hypothetical protein